MTSPGDVEVSVEDIEDEEKMERLGKAIIHFIFEKIIFCNLSKYALCNACNHCIGTGSDDKNGIL